MFLIQPCCTQKNLLALRRKLGADGTCFWHGHGDLSMAEILPVLLMRYSNVDMMLVTPSLPDGCASVVAHLMDRRFAAASGSGKINNIGHLTLVTCLQKKKSPAASAWVKDNPWGDRLTLVNVQQNDTAVILPDIAVMGPVNLVYGGHFTALATRRQKTIDALREAFGKLL